MPEQLFDGDDWRKRKPNQPFFAQFQISEPHRPFPIPDEFPDDIVNAIELPEYYPDHPLIRRDWYAYLRSVEMVDSRVGAILDQLEQAGVLDDTIVMFFADHGRAMPWGKQWLTVEGLSIPLLVRGPNMTQSLNSWVQATVDRGALPDPPSEPSLAEIKKEKRAGYQRVWKGRIMNPEPTDEQRVAWWQESYGLANRSKNP